MRMERNRSIVRGAADGGLLPLDFAVRANASGFLYVGVMLIVILNAATVDGLRKQFLAVAHSIEDKLSGTEAVKPYPALHEAVETLLAQAKGDASVFETRRKELAAQDAGRTLPSPVAADEEVFEAVADMLGRLYKRRGALRPSAILEEANHNS